MTKSEIIEYLYEINTHSDLTIEQMASDLADRPSDPHNITYINALKNRIRELEAKRPQGEWIKISSPYSLDRIYRCSVCGEVIEDMPMDEYYDPAYKGCPYCLARMKGADDE